MLSFLASRRICNERTRVDTQECRKHKGRKYKIPSYLLPYEPFRTQVGGRKKELKLGKRNVFKNVRSI